MISIASASISCRVVDRRPAVADDVLVEVLAAAEAEGEPAVGEQLQRRGLLRDDGRVVAHRRAGHVGHQLDPLGRLRDGAEHRPGVRRVALLGRATASSGRSITSKSKPASSARDGVAHQLLGAALLGHQGVAEARHAVLLRPGRSGLVAHPYPTYARSMTPAELLADAFGRIAEGGTRRRRRARRRPAGPPARPRRQPDRAGWSGTSPGSRTTTSPTSPGIEQVWTAAGLRRPVRPALRRRRHRLRPRPASEVGARARRRRAARGVPRRRARSRPSATSRGSRPTTSTGSSTSAGTRR